MNHVWPSIALRSPCAVAALRPLRRQPALQLFHSYGRRQITKCGRNLLSSDASPATSHIRPALSTCGSILAPAVRAFSSSSLLAARKKNAASRPRAANLPGTRIAPASKAASHTEGSELVDGDGTLSWRDYAPEGGMPLPDGQERSAEQIREIFGGAVDAEMGNYVLKVMHWRRMSGALIDSGVGLPADTGVSTDTAVRGLEYVRALLPNFDEQAAGQVWVDEESHRLELEIQARALRLGIYKRVEPEDEEEQEPESDQGTEYGRARSGQSHFERMRRESEAAWEAEQAAKAIEAERAERAALHAQRGPLDLAGGVQPSTQLTTVDGTGISISRPGSGAWLQPAERKPWVKYYEETAMLIKDNNLPQLSLLQRLGPALLVVCAVLLLGGYVAEHYTPAPKSARIWPEWPPAVATLVGLSATLAAFFVLGRMPPLWRTYSKYFTVVPAYPHGLGVVGAIFRHDKLNHLLINLASLWLFGLILHDDVGRGAYLAVFIASGAAGGFASLTQCVLRGRWETYIFGASGAVLGTVGAACTLSPNGTLKVYGQEIPIAAWVFAALYGCSEAFAIYRGRASTIDHVGHLGGLLTGAAMAGWWRWKASRRREESLPEGMKEVKVEGAVA